MPRHHRHSGSRRGASDGEQAQGGEPRAKAGERRRRRGGSRRSPSGASRTPRGKRYSLYSLVFAIASIALLATAELIARANHEPTLTPLNLLGAAATLAALATGAYAIASLARHESQTVRRRLLVSLPIAVCAGLAVTSNFFDKHRQLAPTKAAAPTAAAPAVAAAPVDDHLIKPGWFGEILSDGLLLTISSFEENAAESRRFNRGLFKPVHYARLTVVNAGNINPVSVPSVEASLRMKDGSTSDCLNLRDLLSHGASQGDLLLKRLTENQTIHMGGMVAEIPVCTDTNVSWSQVLAVNVRLGSRTLVVPGRVMSAREKMDILEKGAGAASPATNGPPSASDGQPDRP
jgi:hypothetical protein